MTHAETLAMYIANCQCCLLATAMKDCQNCPFRVGLKPEAQTEQKETQS